MRKKITCLLWALLLSSIVQGCRKGLIRERVTIHLDGQPIELQFAYLPYYKKNVLKEILEILETKTQIDPNTGKKIDLNHHQTYHILPLNMALDYVMGNYWNYGNCRDIHFYAVQYLLVHGANPNQEDPFALHHEKQSTVMHRFCELLGDNERNIDIRGMVLLLSYGAQLSVANKMGKTPLDIINRKKPWIPQTMRQDDGWAATAQTIEEDLKKIYFTEIAEELLKLPQYRKKVDTAFLNYLKEAGVEDQLITRFASRRLQD